eukprot:TRINITY_DN12529_c0_g1_i3.p1 TRINITY_DN12529_c0_g1~~TRINITY_DN12529_c0_g1_i3.p1  ORF type:complete len:456 (+),score=99.04 TRINITY_DN12529_c0_g1_i3:923-2290(+)
MTPRWKKTQSLELPAAGNWMQHHANLESGVACFSQAIGIGDDSSLYSSKLHFMYRNSSGLWDSVSTMLNRTYGQTVTALNCRRNLSILEAVLSFASDMHVYHRVFLDLETSLLTVRAGPWYNLTNSTALQIDTCDISFVPPSQLASTSAIFATERRSNWERSSFLAAMYNESDVSVKSIGPTNSDFNSMLTRSRILYQNDLVVNIASTSLMTLSTSAPGDSWPIYKSPLKTTLQDGIFLVDQNVFVLVDELNSMVFVQKGEKDAWSLAKRYVLPEPLNMLDVMCIASIKGSSVFNVAGFEDKNFLLILLDGGVLSVLNFESLLRDNSDDLVSMFTWDLSDTIGSLLCLLVFVLWCWFRQPRGNQQPQAQSWISQILTRLTRNFIVAVRYLRQRVDQLEVYLLQELNNWRQPAARQQAPPPSGVVFPNPAFVMGQHAVVHQAPPLPPMPDLIPDQQ